MLSMDDLLAALHKECDVAAHLATKIPADGLDWRATPDARSNLEVLHYAAFCGIGGALYCTTGTWDGYKAWQDRQADVSPENAAAKFADQKAALSETLGAIAEADYAREVTHPFGFVLPLNRALLEMPLKWLTGYRMQLYLGAKAAGNTEIWTPDCWHGVSKERPEASAS